MHAWNTRFLLGWPIFRGEHVSSREGICLIKLHGLSKSFELKKNNTLWGVIAEGIRRTGLEEGDSENHEVIDKAHR